MPDSERSVKSLIKMKKERTIPRQLAISVIWLMITFFTNACSSQSPLQQHISLMRDLQNNPELPPQTLATDNFSLHYRQYGTAIDAIVVWVHGTPGNWADVGQLILDKDFTESTLVVAIDRPGWGSSQYIDQPRLVTDFDTIAELIRPLLHKLKLEHPEVPLILAGHSWGGSVIPAVAAQFPNCIDGLAIFAAGLDPDLVKPRWYNRLANTWLIKPFLGKTMRSANVEMYALSEQMTKLKPAWENLTVPTVVVQGMKDPLVSPANADFAETVLNADTGRVLKLPKTDHFLQMHSTDLIKRCLLALADGNPQACSDEPPSKGKSSKG